MIAKGDSAVSAHYWRAKDVSCLEEISTESGAQIRLPDNSTIQANSQGILPHLPELSPIAKKAIFLPSFKSASLISLGQRCEDECNILLNKRLL